MDIPKPLCDNVKHLDRAEVRLVLERRLRHIIPDLLNEIEKELNIE